MSGYKTKLFHTQLATTLLAFFHVATGVILARALGPEDRGILATIVLWPVLLASISLLGVHEALAYFLGISKEKSEEKKYIAASFTMALGFLALGTLIYQFFIPSILSKSGEEYLLWGRLFSSFIFFQGIAVYFTVLSIAQGNIFRYNALRLAAFVLYLLGLILYAATQNLGIEEALGAHLAATIAIAALWLYLEKPLGVRFRWQHVRDVAAKAKGFSLGVFTAIVLVQLDKLVAIELLDLETIGMYVVAHAFVYNGLQFFLSSQQSLAFPASTKMDHATKKVFFIKNFNFCFYISLFTALLIIFLSKPLITLLFGDEFAPALEIIPLLSAAYGLIFLKLFGSRFMRTFGNAKIGNTSDVILAALFLTVTFLTLQLTDLAPLQALLWSLIFAGTVANAYFLAVSSQHLSVSKGLMLSPKLFWDSATGAAAALKTKLKRAR